MTVSTETVRMAKSRPRKNQSERLDLPCHIIIVHNSHPVTGKGEKLGKFRTSLPPTNPHVYRCNNGEVICIYKE